MTPTARRIIWVFVLIAAVGIAWKTASTEPRPPKVTYSVFLQSVEAGNVRGVVIAPRNSAAEVTYQTRNGSPMWTVFPSDYRDAILAMQNKGVDIEIEEPSTGWMARALNAAPFLLLVGFWIILMQRLRSRGSRDGLL